MGLVATLREVQENTSPEQLNRYNPERAVMVDGSLSEMVTQALNIAYSKKNLTSGEPYYGQSNPTGNPVPGAGVIPNIQRPDTPRQDPVVKPSLESMQQDRQIQTEQVAAVLADAYNAKDKGSTSYLNEKPLVVYALPQTGMVPEEMNADIDMYHDSGAVNICDFVFVYTDANDRRDMSMGNGVVDLNQKVKDYEGKGARVYKDLQSFLVDLPNIRRK
jgi:hypothetical protein